MRKVLLTAAICFIAVYLIAQTHTSAVLDVAQTWTATQTFNTSVTTQQTLTDGATVTWNTANGMAAALTFTVHSGSRTLNLTNLVQGGTYVLQLIQDGTGGENLTGGTGCTWKQLGGGAGTFTLTATASAVDVLTIYYDGTNCNANLGKNYS